jgi:hypothetical protein
VRALRDFLVRVEGERTPAEREQRLRRDALYAGVDRASWADALAAPLDLALLRALHRAVMGEQTRVRRADRDGRWVLADARPGLLRTKPQSFRSGDHVELGWDQGALQAKLRRLLHEIGPAFADDPVRHGAHLVWAITRAQPFAGHNTRLALTVVSLCLRRAGWPALPVADAERDPALIDALAAASTDRGALETTLVRMIWAEALAYAEWLAPVAADGWTLAGEARALAELRRRVVTVERGALEAFTDRATSLVGAALAAHLGVAVGAGQRAWLSDPTQRLQLAWTSAARGRWLCPRDEMVTVGWRLGDGIDAVLVVGAAGRGLSGGVVAHLALGAAPAPGAAQAPAMLVIPDENPAERETRLAAWAEPAVIAARRASALRF